MRKRSNLENKYKKKLDYWREFADKHKGTVAGNIAAMRAQVLTYKLTNLLSSGKWTLKTRKVDSK